MMKKILLIALLATGLSAGSVIFEEKDKQAHMAVTGMVAAITTVVMRENDFTPTQAFMTAMAAGLLIGVAKEVYDKNNGGKFDNVDMMANFLGSLGGASIITMTYKF